MANVFDMEMELVERNGGAERYVTQQMTPTTSFVTGRPGLTGSAASTVTFEFQDDFLWWNPSLSYFEIRLHVTAGDGVTALGRPPTNGLALIQNWPAALFQQVVVSVNSAPLHTLIQVPQADTMIAMTTCSKSWLESTGSAQGLGQSLMERIASTGQFGTGAASTTNYQENCAIWRPNVSIFDQAGCMPPGARWRFDFNWNQLAEQYLIENGLGASALAGTAFEVFIDSFVFYKAVMAPAHDTPLPSHGCVELEDVTMNAFSISSGTVINVNVPAPASTNRVLIAFQDNNTANNLAFGQNSISPITNFAVAFSSGATRQASYLQALQVNYNELAQSYPNPQYQFTLNANGSTQGFDLAFADMIHVCQGSSGGYEGALKFGNPDPFVNVPIVAPLLTGGGPVVQAGLGIGAGDAMWLYTAGTGATTYTATSSQYTALSGWIGRFPIFAFPCVRPPEKQITTFNVVGNFSSSITAVNMFVLCQASKILAVERRADGKYTYTIMPGN